MYGPKFNGPLKVSKFAESVTVSNPSTGEVLYQSNKLTQANNATSVNMGEIRAGIGNGIVAIVPSDTNATAEITDVNLSLAMRAYQTGGLHGYGAPTLVCQNVTATGTSISIDPSVKGTPIAGQGFTEAFAYVQTVGQKSTIESDGMPYSIGTDGSIEGFVATSGTTYKVWYWVNSATTEYTTILSYIDPTVVNLRLSFPVFANVKKQGSGSRIGSMVIIYPYFKLNGDATSNGDGSNNMTTSVSGMAIRYEDDTVQSGCDDCVDATDALVHYLYIPCDGGVDAIQGLYYLGGMIEMDAGETLPLEFKLMVNNSPVVPSPGLMTYQITEPLDGLTVSKDGVVTAGTTAGEAEIMATYSQGGKTFSAPVQITVSQA